MSPIIASLPAGGTPTEVSNLTLGGLAVFSLGLCQLEMSVLSDEGMFDHLCFDLKKRQVRGVVYMGPNEALIMRVSWRVIKTVNLYGQISR